jgi:hypothetical protein
MISSIVFIILQIMNLVNTDNLNALWKIYIPVCIIEMVVYFRCLFKWSEK